MPRRVPNPHTARSGATVVRNQPEALALFARMTMQPSARRKQLVNQLVAGLQAAGSWSSIVALIDPSMETAQAASLNWTGVTANDAQPSAGLVHVPNKGWTNWSQGTAIFPLAATPIGISFIMGGVFTGAGNAGDPGLLTPHLANGSQNGNAFIDGDGGLTMQGVAVASNGDKTSPGVFGRSGNGVYFPYGYDVDSVFVGGACTNLRIQRGGRLAISSLGLLLVFQDSLTPAAMRASMLAVARYLEDVGALNV